MTLASYADFGRIRLVALAPNDLEVEHFERWEYMGRTWVGEAIGFSDVLQLTADPAVTRCVSIDLVALPLNGQKAVFDAVGLSLTHGMALESVCDSLGVKPTSSQAFVADRRSYCFHIGNCEPYRVYCTVHREFGLIHVAILRMDCAAFPEQRKK